MSTLSANIRTAIANQSDTGVLAIANSRDAWQSYYFMGRLLYATGGPHRVRRWHRMVGQHGARFLSTLPSQLPEAWEYEIVGHNVNLGKIRIEAARLMIRQSTLEALVDIISNPQSCQIVWKTGEELNHLVGLWSAHDLLDEALLLWGQWEAFQQQVASHSFGPVLPTTAPVVLDSEHLRHLVGTETYGNLGRLLTGQHSFWDIARQLNCSIADTAAMVLPLIRDGAAEFQHIDDLPYPSDAIPASLPSVDDHSCLGPTIAWIAKDPHIGQQLEELLANTGYHIFGISDPWTELDALMTNAPELIFFEWDMPNVDPYQICAALRKHDAFKATPIVMVTNQDSLTHRMRAKFVGVTEQLVKPLVPYKLLAIAQRHLDLTAVELGTNLSSNSSPLPAM